MHSGRLPSAREKIVFACGRGLLQWKRIPCGLCNATATFHRLMAQVLNECKKEVWKPHNELR